MSPYYHILSLSVLPGPSGKPEFGGHLERLAAKVTQQDDERAGHAETLGVERVVLRGDAVERRVVGVVVVERLHRLEDLRRLERLLPLQSRPRRDRVRLVAALEERVLFICLRSMDTNIVRSKKGRSGRQSTQSY